ncbi:MAG TPA: hypothetical protein VN611_05335 [Patescibacteria group bacterium]|nr:hypothetical protein [Patescibacteria group bacterium]
MKQFSCSTLSKTILLGIVAMIILAFPAITHAYSYQNNDFLFRLECPQQPVQVVPINGNERGVGLDFGPTDADPYLWLIQVQPDNFIDPRPLSPADREKLLEALKKENYGTGKICESASFINVGKYEGVLLLIRDPEDRLAITMVQTERGCYLLTLVGSLSNDSDFNQKLQIYKQGLLSFATL